MCIKHSSKTVLNPKAQEWQPLTPPLQPHQLLPHVILPPPPAAAEQVPPIYTTAAAATPHMLLPHHHHIPYQHDESYYYYYLNPQSLPSYDQGFTPYNGCTLTQPLYYYTTTIGSFPAADNYVCNSAKAAKLFISGGEATVLDGGDMKRHYHDEENVSWTFCKEVESPKSPPVHVEKNASRRVFPPRLQRATRSFHKKPPSPPQLKQEWRPRRSAKLNHNVSGGCAAAFPPPPPFSDEKISFPSKTTVMIKNIPNQLRKRDNLGYAFVNFTSGGAAMKFKEVFQNYSWNMGKEALIKRFQNSSFTCDELDFLPVVLDPPRNGFDPNPAPPMILGTMNLQAFTKNY
ncbi:hypothetical protein BUALT_Bualt08G0125200 [Buddleja alternifolia]|uniref:Mei2-like C-terminal RNA recognition motif domain-containing protein n=1 Tax=Buddleja alternifolia TaxID=168488 RepID=A0AAV6X9Q6_9LAMI|nr:hypothetical protein BUALT_Bualt08G0125200 [Buddleja alternifolia]